MADEYGIDVAIGADGDLVVGPTGALALVGDTDNVVQALRLRMMTTPGELPLHPDYGSDLKRRLVGSKIDEPFAASVANIELRRLLEQDQRFAAATDVTIRTGPETPNVEAVSATLVLAGGEQLTVESLADPRADEINFDDAPTLADFSDDPSLDTFDGAGFSDLDDDLPDLESFIGEGLTTTDVDGGEDT